MILSLFLALTVLGQEVKVLTPEQIVLEKQVIDLTKEVKDLQAVNDFLAAKLTSYEQILSRVLLTPNQQEQAEKLKDLEARAVKALGGDPETDTIDWSTGKLKKKVD